MQTYTGSSKIISTLQGNIEAYEKNRQIQSEKIVSQELLIADLQSRLQNFETIIAENNELSNEVIKLNDILEAKNKLITEFQQVTESSTMKFEAYMDKNFELKNLLSVKKQKFKELKIKTQVLEQRNMELEKENEQLKREKKQNEQKYSEEVAQLKNEIDGYKEREIILSKNNDTLKQENQKSSMLIDSYIEKMRNLESVQKDNYALKNEINRLSNAINEKDKNINSLQVINNELRDKNLDISKEIASMNNYQNSLEKKIESLKILCKEYEISLKRNQQNIEENSRKLLQTPKIFHNRNWDNDLKFRKYESKIRSLSKQKEDLKDRENTYQDCLKGIKNFTTEVGKKAQYHCTSPNRSYCYQINSQRESTNDKLNYSHMVIDNLRDTLNTIDAKNRSFSNMRVYSYKD